MPYALGVDILPKEATVHLFSRPKPPKFDQKDYKDFLAALLKAAQDEYKLVTYDRRTMQHGILRNYLWLSTVMFSVECTGIYQVASNTGAPWPMYPSTLFWILAGLSLISSLACFCFGVDTMRGRGVVLFPYQVPFESLMSMAHQEASRDLPVGRLYMSMIRDLEKGINQHRAIATTVGKKLRYISWGLLFSLACAVLAVLAAVIEGALRAAPGA